MEIIVKGMYIHRGHGILKSKHGKGWETDCNFEIFKTLSDAQAMIDKEHDGSNRKQPEIIGEIKCDKEGKLVAKYF